MKTAKFIGKFLNWMALIIILLVLLMMVQSGLTGCHTVKKSSQSISVVKDSSATVKVDSTSKHIHDSTDNKSKDSTGINETITDDGLNIIFSNTDTSYNDSPVKIIDSGGVYVINPGGRKISAIQAIHKKSVKDSAAVNKSNNSAVHNADTTSLKKNTATQVDDSVKTKIESKVTETPWWVIGLKAIVIIALFAGIVAFVFFYKIGFTIIPPFITIVKR